MRGHNLYTCMLEIVLGYKMKYINDVANFENRWVLCTKLTLVWEIGVCVEFQDISDL